MAEQKTLQPTTRLRFVERQVRHDEPRTVRVLQQWWQDIANYGEGEWHDVPLEQE